MVTEIVGDKLYKPDKLYKHKFVKDKLYKQQYFSVQYLKKVATAMDTFVNNWKQGSPKSKNHA